jgi:hypothetical protein
MRDPHPDNISGQKVQRHVFKHEIQWGYVLLAVVALIAMWQLSGAVASSAGDETDESDTSSPL